MKHINNLINAENPRSSIGYEPETRKESEQDRINSERLMDRLWQRLSEVYGHQLHSQYGEVMPESWERLLKGVTPDQIKDGLNRLSVRTEAWPPNAVEFRQLCMPETLSPSGINSGAYIAFNDPAHPDFEAPRIESDEQKASKNKAANSALSDMKNMFNIKEK